MLRTPTSRFACASSNADVVNAVDYGCLQSFRGRSCEAPCPKSNSCLQTALPEFGDRDALWSICDLTAVHKHACSMAASPEEDVRDGLLSLVETYEYECLLSERAAETEASTGSTRPPPVPQTVSVILMLQYSAVLHKACPWCYVGSQFCTSPGSSC